jgi:hypothetical protein
MGVRFLLSKEQGLERLNVARMSATGDGWTEPNHYYHSCRNDNANKSRLAYQRDSRKAVSFLFVISNPY